MKKKITQNGTPEEHERFKRWAMSEEGQQVYNSLVESRKAMLPGLFGEWLDRGKPDAKPGKR